MHDDFVAVGTATDLRAHANELRRRWDSSFGLGRPRGVRPVIERSWSRMIGAGIDPDGLSPRRALDDDQLAAVREASPLRAVLPDLRGCLAGLADDAEHILVVGDAVGRLLWIEGHDRVLDQARAIDFVPGMSWVESSAGTNAIGTALAIDHAVQIFSAEHFLAEQHPWWCSAAPIHDPVDGSVLGVIDLSGPQRTAHPHSLGLVMAAATMAEQALRRQAEYAAAAAASTIGTRTHRSAVPFAGVQPRGDHGTPDDASLLDTAGLTDAAGLTVDPGARPDGATRLRLLTAHEPVIDIPGRERLRLSGRQAEVLALLALHPAGMTAEQLTIALYGDAGNPVTTRALLSRLREVVGDVVVTRPYRLAPTVRVDLRTVRHLLLAGDDATALAMYPGPLLEASEVPAIRAARTELDLAMRSVAMRGGVDGLWRWLDTATGRDDLAAVERFLAAAAADDPRRLLAAARREAIIDDWADDAGP